ncbi:MAG: immunity 17 family protein [Deltaproteobacteria bacterium]|jgi:hypothetical protein|nr:immunity 17 family protein [Deltaproteobacteria bacterium]
MDKEPDVFARIGKFLGEEPEYFAVFVILVGVFMLAAAVCNWDWIFQGHSYNTKKIEGVANVWGRGFARLKFGGGGLVCVIIGIVLLLLLMYSRQ